MKGVTEALDARKFGLLLKPFAGLSRNNVIASYATKHKALAVLSDDSDFLIYGGNWKFWSIKELNSQTMTTMEFNKQKLRLELELNDREMCMLATVGGNDFVKYNDVTSFHRSIGPYHSKFFNIANYIKSFPQNISLGDLAMKMAMDLFGNTSQELIERVKSSLMSYRMVSDG